MIWESTAIMTVIDLLVISVTGVAVRLLIARKSRLTAGGAFGGPLLLGVGLATIGGFYLLDLGTMYLLPLFASRATAMSVMRDLHLNYGWVIIPFGAMGMLGGFVIITRGIIALLERSERAGSLLDAELVARRDAERQRQLVADSAPALIAYVDGERRYQFVNPGYRSFFGHKGAIVGRPVQEILGEKYAEVSSHMDTVLAGAAVDFEIELRQDGQRSNYFKVHYEPDVDDDGITRGFFSHLTDVTDRRHIEAQLEQSEQHIGLVTDTMPVLIAYVDVNRRYRFVNKRYEQTFGSPLGMLIEEQIGRQAGEETLRALKDGIEAALGGQAVHFETDFRDSKNRHQYFSVRYEPDFDTDGSVKGFYSLLWDVSEIKLAEAAARESDRKYRQIVDTASEGIWVIDTSGDTTFVNRRMADMLGYSIDEMMGRSMYAFMEADVRKEAAHSLEKRDEEIVESFDSRFRRKDGSDLWAVISTTPMLDEAGTAVGALGMITDITRRKQAEQELAFLVVELEDRVAARTADLEAFAYSVAHDLRAPLRAMQGFSSVLLEDYAERLDDDGRSYLARIATGSERMGHLIEDLLEYVRLGRTEVARHSIDLSQALTDVMQDLATEIEYCGADVVVTDPIYLVLADETTLSQVLVNLLTNAMKFVAAPTQPRVWVHAEQIDGHVRLWIEDNGIGIAEEYSERIFQVFERLHSSESYPGTGIGLAIVRRGIERMGGDVGFESDPGKGSRFWIDLPRAEGALD